MLSAGIFLVLTLLAVLVGGCGQKSAESPSAASSIDAVETRTLCLADPAAFTPLDMKIRNLQQQAKALPKKPDVWIQLGRAWVQKARMTADPGFYLNVEGCAKETLQIDSHNSAALGLRALALMNHHQFKEAQAVAKQILRRSPNDLIALGIRSDALLELGQFEDAAKTTQQMIDVRPDMASYSRASYVCWLQGDAANAKLLIRHALEGRDIRDPEPAAWTFVQAAILFWNEADYDGADAVFAEALKWVADYPVALVGRARVALSKGQPNRAIEYLEKAYRISPLAETAWLLGDARTMLGDFAGAETEYERVIREGRKADRLTLAQFYATKNRAIDEALRLIEEERRVRNNIYVDDTYAWIIYRTGRIEEARRASDRALRLGTRDARLLFHAGAIRIAGGDPKGRKLIQQALALNPKFDWTGAAEARKLLNSYAKN